MRGDNYVNVHHWYIRGHSHRDRKDDIYHLNIPGGIWGGIAISIFRMRILKSCEKDKGFFKTYLP